MKETLNFSQAVYLCRTIIGVNIDCFLHCSSFLMETCVYRGVGADCHASVGQHATLLKPMWMTHTAKRNFQKQFHQIDAVG